MQGRSVCAESGRHSSSKVEWMEQQVNRRRWQRYSFDASVRVVVDRSTDKTTVYGRGVRLSEGGICIFAAANLPVGSDINVEFKNPHTHQPVRLRGKVRNRSVYLYGVEFLHDELKAQQELARLGAEYGGGSA
jgi:c-di-GMP-binding flagellar brake protein YcgR